jgi:hypothetical protein
MFKQTTPGWKFGEWLGICQVCGWKKRSSELFKRWDGLIVCAEDLEPRHPQEFVRPRVDNQKVAFTRPESLNVFLGPTVNCATATFREISASELQLMSEVIKARVQGPVEISNTLSVVCTLEIY